MANHIGTILHLILMRRLSMGLINNIKTFINVGFLAGTDATVTKVFGDYDTAAQAQADINRLAAVMDSNIVCKKFSKRKSQEQLFLEDLLGEKEEPKKEEPKSRQQTLLEWWNSLSDEEKQFFKELNK